MGLLLEWEINISKMKTIIENSFKEQIDPDKSKYECFFHYTDYKVYEAGFEQGVEWAKKRYKL